MISVGARYATSERLCTVTPLPGRASASSVTTVRPGLPGRLKGVLAGDHLHGFAPDCPPDRVTLEKGGSEVEMVAFAGHGKRRNKAGPYRPGCAGNLPGLLNFYGVRKRFRKSSSGLKL